MKHFTFIDLFSGCGGFSLGMIRAGFKCVAAIDSNAESIATFKRNFSRVPQVLQEDLTSYPPEKLARLAKLDHVDIIVGGPPCQGFSTVRQVDGANHGKRLVRDKRRSLYRHFLRYVEFFQPKAFVMENVLGIRSASDGRYLARVQKGARALGYRVHAQTEDCVNLGLAQKRRRQLFIGTRLDLPSYFRQTIKPAPRACGNPTLWTVIGDLPPLKAGKGQEKCRYNMERRKAHVKRHGRGYLYKVNEVQHAATLTAHRARQHSERDLRDFALLKEGENSDQAMRRGVVFKFPYDRENFKDRYTRQHRSESCSTIVAHLSKDGLMFIHPTQNRTLTPREAARIQSFPDWFEFPVARTHQYRIIGNAVPPLVGEAIGIALRDYLKETIKRPKTIKKNARKLLPRNEGQAAKQLLSLVQSAGSKTLRKLPTIEFKRGWFSVGFLYPGLHPAGGQTIKNGESEKVAIHAKVRDFKPRLLTRYLMESGWPIVLAPVAREAWRRHKDGELKIEDFYCDHALAAGISYRRSLLPVRARDGHKKNPSKQTRETRT